MPKSTATATFHSRCEIDGDPIHYLGPSEFDGRPVWLHDIDRTYDHLAQPELRFTVDATCPGCGFPEIGFAPTREEFVCSRCQHTQNERPKD